MKKNVLLVILFSFLGVIGLTANEKDIVYIEEFKYPERISASNATNLRNKVIEGLMAKDRMILKDSNAETTLKATVKTTTTAKKAVKPKAGDTITVARDEIITVEEKIDNATLEKYKKLKAKYIIRGQITTLEATEKTKDDGSSRYEAVLGFSLTLVNVNTGAIEAVENYKFPNGIVPYTLTGATEAEALIAAYNDTPVEMDKFVDRYFPVSGKVLQVTKENKNKAQEVYIDLGTKHGIQKGQRFEVFVARNIAGRIAESKVGELQAEAVEADDLTRCKVNGGKTQEAVKEAMDKGEAVTVQSMEQKKSMLNEGMKMLKF